MPASTDRSTVNSTEAITFVKLALYSAGSPLDVEALEGRTIDRSIDRSGAFDHLHTLHRYLHQYRRVLAADGLAIRQRRACVGNTRTMAMVYVRVCVGIRQ